MRIAFHLPPPTPAKVTTFDPHRAVQVRKSGENPPKVTKWRKWKEP